MSFLHVANTPGSSSPASFELASPPQQSRMIPRTRRFAASTPNTNKRIASLEKCLRNVQVALEDFLTPELLHRLSQTVADGQSIEQTLNQLRREISHLEQRLSKREASHGGEESCSKRIRVDDSTAREEIKTLKRTIESLQISEMRNSERHQQQLEEAQGEIQKHQQRLRYLSQEEQSGKVELQRLRQEKQAEIRSLQKSNAELGNMNRYLHSKSAEWEEKYRDYKSSTVQQLQALQEENENLKQNFFAMREQLSRQQEHQSDSQAELQAKVLQAELKKVKQEAQISSRQHENAKETIQKAEDILETRKKLRQALANEQILKTKLREAQQQLDSNAVLKEKNRDSDARRARVEARLQSLEGVHAENKRLLDEGKEWFTVFAALSKSSEVLDLIKVAPARGAYKLYKDLQNEQLEMAMDKSRLQARVAELQHLNDQHIITTNTLESELSELKMKCIQQEHKNTVLEEQLAARIKKNKELLDFQDSLEKAAKIDQASASTLEESQVVFLKRQLEEKEEQVQKYVGLYMNNPGPNAMGQLNKVRQQLKEEEKNYKQVLRELQETQLCMDKLNRRNGSTFNPKKTKVLHFKDNPLSEAFEEHHQSMDKLRRDNERLQSQIKDLRESSDPHGTPAASTSASTPASSFNSGSDPIILNQRLKQTFQDRIHEFKTAVYLLTGYKVDLSQTVYKNTMFSMLRLRSMYAEREEDDIKFLMDEKQQLIPSSTRFLEQLNPVTKSAMRYSVPAFLSSVQLELYEKQTIQPRS